ncbi:conserved hypothetical protein [Vibrio phage 501E54-1]|nr:conserved hypothetical protein [Vibrio phage 501E54-1]
MFSNHEEKLKTVFKSFMGSYTTDKCSDNIEYFIKNVSQDMVLDEYNKRQDAITGRNQARQKVREQNVQIKKDLLEFVKNHEHVDRLTISRKIEKSRGGLYAHWGKVIKDMQMYEGQHQSSLRPYDSKFYFKFTYNGSEYQVYTSISNIVQRIKGEIARINATALANNVKYVKALDYIKEHSLNSEECITSDDYLELCHEHAKDVYFESVKGAEIDVTHGNGDDCTWEIGAHRCICGNNRYYLEIEGDFTTGFYSYGQWC